MWFIILWLFVGAAAGIAGLVVLVWIVDFYDTARSRRREALRRAQREAEHRLQRVTQEALQRMLDVARTRS